MNRILFALAAFSLAGTAAAQTARPLALDAAEQYRAQARYPESSRPIAAGAIDPILAKREVSRHSAGGPGGAAPMLNVWTSGIVFQAGQRVQLFAQLVQRSPDDGPASVREALQPGVIGARITAELTAERSGALGRVTYRDDGRGGDRTASDGVYTAEFLLPKTRGPAAGTAENVLVLIDAVSTRGDQRRTSDGFLYSHPGARLTGRYRDGVKGGNLMVGAEIEVAVAGRYHLAGTLSDARGNPVAHAQAAQQLAAGRHWIELPYYGLIFHELGSNGRYTLSAVTLTTAGQMPNALGPVVRNAHVTQVHPMEALTARPFGQADLMETARRLEADAAR